MNKKQKIHKSIVAGNGNAVSVVDKDLNFALRNFKRKVKESRVIEQYKDNREFIKFSVKRKNEINRAKYIQKLRDMDNF
jgi:small subunit ribosomal protein S21